MFKSTLGTAQGGIATLLIVMLTGAAMMVSIVGTTYYLRTKQAASTASHAVTNAQASVIVASVMSDNAVKTKLNSSTVLSDLVDGNEKVITFGDDTTVTLTKAECKTTSCDTYVVRAYITYTNATTKTTSKIEVFYEVTPTDIDDDATDSTTTATTTTDSAGNTTDSASIMSIYSNFTASGQIVTSSTDSATINVDGTFKTNGINITGVQTLNTTGDVSLDSATTIPYVYTNGNITLSGSAAISKIASAKGYILNGGWGTNGSFYADGNITNNGGVISTLNTTSNIVMSQWSTISTALANGSITCVSSYWSAFTSLTASSFSSCPTSSSVITSTANSATGALATVSLASSQPLINALSYESDANYAFSVDSSSNIMVTVKNVSGITDGTYYLATNSSDAYQGSSKVYLCASGTSCTNPVGKIATPYWNYYPITYSSGTWALSDTQYANPAIAPGVVLFYGNLSITLGTHYVNSFLATGNITYGGSVVLYAPNYAGASEVCNTSYGMPTNLCTNSTTMSKAVVGNYALLAGSCTDATSVTTCSANYTGGNITLGASAKIYGNVIAGNLINTSGSTTIVGGITAAGLGDTSSGSSVGGATTFEQSTLSSHTDFTAGVIKGSTSTSSSSSSETSSETSGATVKFLWMRYL
ncbi:MAG: hypothetical protein QM666_03880 [Acinetobacter sp.]